MFRRVIRRQAKSPLTDYPPLTDLAPSTRHDLLALVGCAPHCRSAFHRVGNRPDGSPAPVPFMHAVTLRAGIAHHVEH
jgi:hypothetical protein